MHTIQFKTGNYLVQYMKYIHIIATWHARENGSNMTMNATIKNHSLFVANRMAELIACLEQVRKIFLIQSFHHICVCYLRVYAI